MLKRYRFYHRATGIFRPNGFGTNDPKLVAANTPADHAALEGEYDHLSQRVDVANGNVVVDYKPPAPSPDHEWNASTKRWQLRPDVAERQAKRKAALARIAQLEQQQARPMRELALDPQSSEARKRLGEIEAEIAELRKAIAALRAGVRPAAANDAA